MLIDSPRARVKENTIKEFVCRLPTHSSAALTRTTIDPPRSANFSRVRRKFTHLRRSRAKDHFDSRLGGKLTSLVQPIVVRVKETTMYRLGALRVAFFREEEVTEKCAKNFALVREKRMKKARAARKHSARLLKYWRKVTKLNYTFSPFQTTIFLHEQTASQRNNTT